MLIYNVKLLLILLFLLHDRMSFFHKNVLGQINFMSQTKCNECGCFQHFCTLINCWGFKPSSPWSLATQAYYRDSKQASLRNVLYKVCSLLYPRRRTDSPQDHWTDVPPRLKNLILYTVDLFIMLRVMSKLNRLIN